MSKGTSDKITRSVANAINRTRLSESQTLWVQHIQSIINPTGTCSSNDMHTTSSIASGNPSGIRSREFDQQLVEDEGQLLQLNQSISSVEVAREYSTRTQARVPLHYHSEHDSSGDDQPEFLSSNLNPEIASSSKTGLNGIKQTESSTSSSMDRESASVMLQVWDLVDEKYSAHRSSPAREIDREQLVQCEPSSQSKPLGGNTESRKRKKKEKVNKGQVNAVGTVQLEESKFSGHSNSDAKEFASSSSQSTDISQSKKRKKIMDLFSDLL